MFYLIVLIRKNKKWASVNINLKIVQLFGFLKADFCVLLYSMCGQDISRMCVSGLNYTKAIPFFFVNVFKFSGVGGYSASEEEKAPFPNIILCSNDRTLAVWEAGIQSRLPSLLTFTEGHEQENVRAGYYETLTPWRIRRFFPFSCTGISQHCWLYHICRGERFDHQWYGKPLTELFHINVHIWKDNLLLLTTASSLHLKDARVNWERPMELCEQWNSIKIGVTVQKKMGMSICPALVPQCISIHFPVKHNFPLSHTLDSFLLIFLFTSC